MVNLILYLLIGTVRHMASKERLIEAARGLLWERGYLGTSPKAIQERSGAKQGSMYHHFTGKADLARQALEATANEMREKLDAHFAEDRPAIDRIARYLRRERDVLRGCRIGRMTYDPEVLESSQLRLPVAATFDWLQRRLTEVLLEGQDSGELRQRFDAAAVASTIVATMQGGYVLARAAASVKPFNRAIEGILCLLESQRAAVQ
jgi:TetR/AcrR family transcriptional regulator, transcriptional repressor for nem operon